MTEQDFDSYSVGLDGSKMIEASAGTGKTYAITALVLRFIIERSVPMSRILVVTFTEAAKEELQTRIRDKLRVAELFLKRLSHDSQAKLPNDPAMADYLNKKGDFEKNQHKIAQTLLRFDENRIHTIHGFCAKTLRDFAFETQLDFETENLLDQSGLTEEIVTEFFSCVIAEIEPKRLQWLQEKKLNFQLLSELAKATQQHLLVDLIPDPPKKTEAIDLEPYIQLFQNTRESWRKHRLVIKEFLLDADCKDRNKYRKGSIPGWIRTLDLFFLSSESHSLALPKPIEKFCQPTLEQFFDPAQVSRIPAFTLFEEFRVEHDRIDQCMEMELLRIKHQFIEFYQSRLENKKDQNGQLFFTDMLIKLDRALQGTDNHGLASLLQKKYDAVLIDEFQDTDPLQYSIFDKMTHRSSSLFFIGDPKQSIYGFRNADVFSFLRAKQGRPTIGMKTNWRSSPGLLNVVNHFFGRLDHAFLLEEILYQDVKAAENNQGALVNGEQEWASFHLSFPTPGFFGLSTQKAPLVEQATETTGQLVASQIIEMIQSGTEIKKGKDKKMDLRPVGFGDIAVLVIKNEQAFLMRRILEDHSIPCAVLSSSSIFECRIARQLYPVLKAVLHPHQISEIKKALVSDLIQYKVSDLLTMEEDEAVMDQWIRRFDKLSNLWAQKGFGSMFERLMVDQEIKPRLLKQKGGKTDLADLSRLGDLLQETGFQEGLGPQELLKWFKLQLNERSKEFGRSTESATDAVRIMTVHKSKGLEFPIVFCPFFWNSNPLKKRNGALFFHDRQTKKGVLDLRSNPSQENLEYHQTESMAEGVRLLYVALTRAKYRCNVVWGKMGSYTSSPLGFLLHLDQEFLSKQKPHTGKDRIKKLSEEEMIEDLKSFKLLTGADFDYSVLTEPLKVPPFVDSLEKSIELRSPRPFLREVDNVWRTGSYSGMLTRFDTEQDITPDKDYDAQEVKDIPTEQEAPKTQSPRVPLADFPKGREVGNFFHFLLETTDFTRKDAKELQDRASELLAQFGIKTDYEPKSLASVVLDLLNTPLISRFAEIRLNQVSNLKRLNELEFLLPVFRSDKDSSSAGSKALSCHDLADAFEEFAEKGGVAEKYTGVLRNLGFRPLKGFLKGYVDLVFEAHGRWYVVDYKTNFLGENARDYAFENLAEDMISQHYILQYHLYSVALHRYLSLRLLDYDYANHFGGVFYLFTRGMSGRFPLMNGVFYDLPPEDLIKALSKTIGGETR